MIIDGIEKSILMQAKCDNNYHMWQTCPNYEVRKIKLFLCDIGCVLILRIEDRYYFLILLVKKRLLFDNMNCDR